MRKMVYCLCFSFTNNEFLLSISITLLRYCFSVCTIKKDYLELSHFILFCTMRKTCKNYKTKQYFEVSHVAFCLPSLFVVKPPLQLLPFLHFCRFFFFLFTLKIIFGSKSLGNFDSKIPGC